VREVKAKTVTADNLEIFLSFHRLVLLGRLMKAEENKIVITAKLKLVKIGYGSGAFRGSRYRGVSKNK
jgi:hypothetical protein